MTKVHYVMINEDGVTKFAIQAALRERTTNRKRLN